MAFFNQLFPNISLWNVNVGSGNILPEGLYAFLEFYCGNPECNCNAGTFDMVEIDSNGKILGERITSIYYAWNELTLDENPRTEGVRLQSKLTKAALEVFKSSMQEYSYLDTIKRHYQMIKNYYIENPTHWHSGELYKKIGRNDYCPCGSGKKYKKCCLYK